MLAEDDEDDVHLFKTVLAELNQDILVTVAADGNLLMAFLNQATTLPEMIFLDLNMPFKNGFICLRESIGFDNTFKNDIFKVFNRVNANQYIGSGIGLAISKKIVENHNGTITATGELNQGAQFDICLPAG